MKKKFLTVAVAAAALCGSILPLAAENMMTAEALTAETQSPVFVEVLPAEEPEQLPEEPVQADPEPADTDPAEPADPADSAQPADTCREAMAAYITGVNESVTKADALTMADAMVKQAEAYDLDEKLLLAMAHTESTYYSDAVSSADCKGLMQTADVLAEEAGYSPEALFDPEISIAVGAGYINDQLDAQTLGDVLGQLDITANVHVLTGLAVVDELQRSEVRAGGHVDLAGGQDLVQTGFSQRGCAQGHAQNQSQQHCYDLLHGKFLLTITSFG